MKGKGRMVINEGKRVNMKKGINNMNYDDMSASNLSPFYSPQLHGFMHRTMTRVVH